MRLGIDTIVPANSPCDNLTRTLLPMLARSKSRTCKAGSFSGTMRRPATTLWSDTPSPDAYGQNVPITGLGS